MEQIKIFEKLYKLPVNSIVWWRQDNSSPKNKLGKHGVAIVVDKDDHSMPWCIRPIPKGLSFERVFCCFLAGGGKSWRNIHVDRSNIDSFDLKLLSPEDMIEHKEDLFKIFFPEIFEEHYGYRRRLLSIVCDLGST